MASIRALLPGAGTSCASAGSDVAATSARPVISACSRLLILLPWVGSNECFAYAARGEGFERSRHFVAQRCGVGERRRHHILKFKDRITQRAGCGGFSARSRAPGTFLGFG